MSKPEFSDTDAGYMIRALELARRGLLTTDPNPRVGCVIVNQGEVVGEGWHQYAGQAHAEVNALIHAGERARGSTVYVTLEPCCHVGRTPPCADTLVNSGVERVVVAMEDPNPLVSGKGLHRLKEAGVMTQSGLFKHEAMQLNPGFIKRMQTGRPLIRSKIAMSLDGRTAMASGESKWITGPESRKDVHKIRARSSAIATGSGTLLADNPSLTARLDDPSIHLRQPSRILLDSRLTSSPDAKFFTINDDWHLLTSQKPDQEVRARIHQLKSSSTGVDLEAVADWLGANAFNEVLFECGAILNGALLASGIVDEWIIYMAPKILGDRGRGIFHLPLLESLSEAPDLKLIDSRQVGADIRFTLIPR